MNNAVNLISSLAASNLSATTLTGGECHDV